VNERERDKSAARPDGSASGETLAPHFGPAKIAMYLKRYHDVTISDSGS
jgi:hypothetical protein